MPFPAAIETMEFGVTGRQQEKTLQTFVVRQKGELLLFELRPGAAGDDDYLDNSEQPTEEVLAISTSRDDLLSASVPSRSNMTRSFIGDFRSATNGGCCN